MRIIMRLHEEILICVIVLVRMKVMHERTRLTKLEYCGSRIFMMDD